MPSDANPENAVAEGLAPEARIWQWSGDESLHPFWAIQRLSADDLKKKNASRNHAQMFNVALKEKQYNVVIVGDVRNQSVSMTMSVSVPMITNERPLVPGEELMLEVAPRAAPSKRKETSWKDDVASVARVNAKAKAKTAAPKPKVAVGLAIESEV